MNIPPCLIGDEVNSTPTISINQCGDLLTSSNATLTWTDANPVNGRIYRVLINGQDFGYSTANQFISVTGLPVDGSQIIKTMTYSDNDGASFEVASECECTAHTDTGNQFTTPALNACGSDISYPYTFTFSDNNPEPGRLYRILINDSPVADFQEPQASALVNSGPAGTINVILQSSDDNGDSYQNNTECQFQAQGVSTQPELNGCGATLTGSSENFSWSDPDQNANTIYDFWLGSSGGARDIYDHVGNNQFADDNVTVSGIPTDGRTIHKTLSIFRDGPGTTPELVQCSCTAATIVTDDLANVFNLDIPKISQGSWNAADWTQISGGLPFAFAPTNMDHLSLIEEGGKCKIRQRHEAAFNGSDRVLTPFDLSNRTSIRVRQTIEVAPNFTWGTTSFSGKLGFGVGGGANTAGGLTNSAGWTLRPSWDAGGELAFYSYAVSQIGANGSFGAEIPTGFFIQPGVPFELEYFVQMNSTFSSTDGFFQVWVNGNMVLNQTGIGWMTAPFQNSSTVPIIDRISWSEFHGGADSQWSPVETTWAQTCRISYE